MDCDFIIIEHKPIAQPRARARRGGGGVYNPSGPIDAYKREIKKQAARLTRKEAGEPVSVTITFQFPRTKKQLSKNAPTGLMWHTKKPDADNLAKAVLDALNGIAWADDCQVCELNIKKHICDKANIPRTLVLICPLSEDEIR